MNKKLTPCDIGPEFDCPFDATRSLDCYNYCGIGSEEDEPDYENEAEEFEWYNF